MPRAIWKGSITFGLVEIPVSLVSAEKSEDDIDFAMLDKRDFSPVGYKRVSKKTGREVPWEDIVKGYEYEPDEYVVVTDADFARANPEAARTVEIIDFVEASHIDPMYFEKPYYLQPAKKNSKGYALLRETLRRTGRVGIARVVIRTRQRLGAVVPRGQVLTLELLRYAHELRSPEEVSAPSDDLKQIGVTEKELKMAERVVEGMADEWKPSRYKDEYHDDLMAFIRKKVESGDTHLIEEPSEEPRARRRGEVVDLMPLLQRSIEQAQSRSGRAPRSEPEETPRRSAKAASRSSARPRRKAPAARKRAGRGGRRSA
jgi:DNA end-binding protein Ku